jgi:hypothetical protein
MKIIKVKVKGVSNYIQHKMIINDNDTAIKGEVDYSEEWKKSLYKDENGIIYIPCNQFESAIINSAKEFKIKGKRGKSYKDLIKSSLFIEPNNISLNKKEPDYIDETFMVVQRSRILRKRPAFKAGWEVEFNINIINEQLPNGILKNILEDAGKYKGIGDSRPRYGRFEVVEFCEVNN